MGLESQSSGFPITLEFPQSKSARSFADIDEFNEFTKQELASWNKVRSMMQSVVPTAAQAASTQIQLLDQVGKANNIKEILDWSSTVGPAYLPLSLGFGPLLMEKLGDNTVAAGIAFSELVKPGSAQWNNNTATVEGLTLATILRVSAYPEGLRRDIEAAVASAARYQAENQTTFIEQKNLLDSCKAEWQVLIDGYAAKAALRAPKEYWESRAKAHEEATESARAAWQDALSSFRFWLLVGSAALFGFIPLVNFSAAISGLDWLQKLSTSLSPEMGNASFVYALKPILLLGTFIGIGAWHLRQTLRDLRSHEHLSEDARERVTMIETYAAMKGSEIPAGELGTILSAIYRPSVTGMLDDGGPITPLEIAVKGLKPAEG